MKGNRFPMLVLGTAFLHQFNITHTVLFLASRCEDHQMLDRMSEGGGAPVKYVLKFQ